MWLLEPDHLRSNLILSLARPGTLGRSINLSGLSFENEHRGRSQDGGGIGPGDHFLPYKFIERTTERKANFTKQLLIAS